MAFKRKEDLHKYEGEYQSPDGDKYDVTIVVYGKKSYVQWKRSDAPEDEVPTVIDTDMLEGLHSWVVEITRPASSGMRQIVMNDPAANSSPFMPNIVDMRSSSIDQQVAASMSRIDNTPPLQSFGGSKHDLDGNVGSMEFRSGVSFERATAQTDNTPQSWSLDGDISNMPQWKQDVVNRKTNPPVSQAKSIKKVGAKELI